MERKYAVKGAEAMIDTYSVPLKTLVDEFHLEIAYASTDYSSIRITVEDVSRPGLQLAGFFDTMSPCVCSSWAMWK